MVPAACLEADRSFGPSVPPGCRSGFDFTLYFEQIVLSIVPAALFLVFAAVRLVRLLRASIITAPSWIHTVKLVSFIVREMKKSKFLILATPGHNFRTCRASFGTSRSLVPALECPQRRFNSVCRFVTCNSSRHCDKLSLRTHPVDPSFCGVEHIFILFCVMRCDPSTNALVTPCRNLHSSCFHGGIGNPAVYRISRSPRKEPYSRWSRGKAHSRKYK